MLRAGLEARPASATLVTMDAITLEHWWTGPDSGPFATWVADRSAADPVHCVRVSEVGRGADGRLVVHTGPVRGTPLPDALERIGQPTVGVAVTLTVPMLDLVVDAVSGAIVLGVARADDVLVDDAGVTVLVDHPPDAVDLTGSGIVRTSETAGATALLHAVRTVWERVDPRAPCRPLLDAAVAEAIGGGVAEARELLRVVRSTAAPRPVRWDPPRDDFDFVEPGPPQRDDLVARLHGWIVDGVPVPGGGKLPVRRLVVGLVVATGLAVAGVFAVSSP